MSAGGVRDCGSGACPGRMRQLGQAVGVSWPSRGHLYGRGNGGRPPGVSPLPYPAVLGSFTRCVPAPSRGRLRCVGELGGHREGGRDS